MTESPEREKGGGDHNQEYRFGQPKSMLSSREQARAMIFKAKANRELERRLQLERGKNQRNDRKR